MNNWRRDLVGVVAVGGFVLACMLLFRGGVIDASLKDVGLVLMGQLAGKFGTVVDYHYGSSAGSSAKDETIKQVTKP